MNTNGIRAAVAALLCVSVSSSAMADGVCVKGFRDTTAAERATMTEVLEGAKAALPAPPEGWIIDGEDSIAVLSNLCRDQESQPWTYDFARTYRRVDDQEQRTATLDAASADASASLAAKQPRLDALTARMDSIGQEIAAAVEGGNLARAEALGKEAEAVGAEYEAVIAEGGEMADLQALGMELSRDLEMEIRVTINASYEEPGYEARAFAPPTGVKSAHRWVDTRSDVPRERAMLLLGTWQPRPETPGFEPVRRAGVSPILAHTVSIHVTADESRIDTAIAAIDMAGLIGATLR